MRSKTIRVLDVNIREHLCDLGIVQTFCKKTHKELTIEKGINIVGYIKIKIPLKKWKSKSNMKTYITNIGKEREGASLSNPSDADRAAMKCHEQQHITKVLLTI